LSAVYPNHFHRYSYKINDAFAVILHIPAKF